MIRIPPDAAAPTWDRTFNASLAHAFVDLAAAVACAHGCGYPFVCWRGRVYAVTLNDDGRAAWPAWDDTGYRDADLAAPAPGPKTAAVAAFAASLVEGGDAREFLAVATALDGLVRDRKEDEAVAINDEGVDAQVRYLRGAGVPESAIVAACAQMVAQKGGA